jgi:hypothetical protein
LSGSSFRVSFASQNTNGTYTVTIGPRIADLLGGLMDQNNNGIPGEPGDVYTFTVTVSLPDLAPSALVVPSSPSAGQTIAVTWRVSNNGLAGAATGWTEQIVASASGVLGSADNVVLGTFTATTPLATGTFADRTLNVTIPITFTGSYTIFVQIDSGGLVAESNKAINVISAPITIAGGPPPVDLVVSQVTVPASAQTGTSMQVQWTVANNGTTTTTVSAWTDTVYLSTDQILDAGDTVLGSFAHSGALASAASYSSSQLVTISQTLAAGTYYVIVFTDSGNQVPEPGAKNNNTTVSSAMAITRALVPDLAISNVTAPASGNIGSPVTVGWTVSNLGAAGAFGNWVDRVYLSPDGTLNGAVSLGDFVRPSTLVAGASYTQSVSVTLPVAADASDVIVVVTNATGSVYEQGATANNQAAAPGPFALTHPDLVAQNVTVPASAQSGSSFTVAWSVADSGTGAATGSWVDKVYLSADSTLDASDTLLGTVPAPSALAVGASYNSSLTATMPNGTNGSFHIIVVTDAGGAVNEGAGGKANNTAVSGALPVTLAPYADLTVTAVGAQSNLVIGNPASLTVSWTVQNNGTGAGATSNWNDEIVLSPDSTLGNADDIVIGTVAHSGALPVGLSYSTTQILSLPANLEGSFTLFVKTDSAGAVYQGPNTAPDFLAASAPVLVALKPYADLVVQNVVAPATGTNNQSVSLSWVVANQGIGTTDTANWSDSVYYSAARSA